MQERAGAGRCLLGRPLRHADRPVRPPLDAERPVAEEETGAQDEGRGEKEEIKREWRNGEWLMVRRHSPLAIRAQAVAGVPTGSARAGRPRSRRPAVCQASVRLSTQRANASKATDSTRIMRMPANTRGLSSTVRYLVTR